jgi:hypothetical protein
MKNLTIQRYTSAEVARAADLEPDTVVDWQQRQLLGPMGTLKTPKLYSGLEAMRFVLMRSLIGQLLTVPRAAEIVSMDPNLDTELSNWVKSGQSRAYLSIGHLGDPGVTYSVRLTTDRKFGMDWGSESNNTPIVKAATKIAVTWQVLQDRQAHGKAPARRIDASGPTGPPMRASSYDVSMDLLRAVSELQLR